jgi:hypothetical protein
MSIDSYIQITHFCEYHRIQVSFLEELENFELIEMVTVENQKCIVKEELPIIEKMIRLHHELEINPAGIDAIFHLLNKLCKKQEEILKLKNKLDLFD